VTLVLLIARFVVRVTIKISHHCPIYISPYIYTVIVMNFCYDSSFIDCLNNKRNSSHSLSIYLL